MNCAIYKCIDKYEDKGIRLECFTETESADAEDIELNDLLSQFGQGLFPDNVIEFFETLRTLMIFESKKHIRISKDQSDKIISVLSKSVSQINSTDVFDENFILNQAKNVRYEIRKIVGLEKNADTT